MVERGIIMAIVAIMLSTCLQCVGQKARQLSCKITQQEVCVIENNNYNKDVESVKGDNS